MLETMKSYRLPLTIRCLLCLLVFFPAVAVRAETTPPRPPCVSGETVHPDYAALDETPQVAVWRDIELSGETVCRSRLQGRLDLAVTLSARFRHAGSLEDLATRIGAISETAGLVYWSSIEQKWRKLITRAGAITGPDGNWRKGEQWRPDFSAAEVRSGEVLWFWENDTRSTGKNLYRFRAIESGPERLVLEVVNESPINFTVLTLFGEHELLSLLSVEKLEDGVWGYYSLSALRGRAGDDFDKSLINRAVAFFRFFQGLPGDSGQPLAE